MIASLLAVLFSIAWTDGFDAALERARAEQKLVVVHLRAGDERANRGADEDLAELAKNETLALMLQGFVLVRTNALPQRIERVPDAPALAIYDPSGELIAAPKLTDDPRQLGAVLASLREQTPLIVRSAELRLQGKAAEADLILGRVMMSVRNFRRAIELLESSAKGFRARQDEATAEYAAVHEAAARYFAGEKLRGRRLIEDNIKKTKSPEVKAEGWLFLAEIHRNEKRLANAIDAYRKAYDAALPGTPALEVARQALEMLDRRPVPPKGTEVRKTAMRIIAPSRAISGRTEMLVEADPHIARVELFVDDLRAAEAKERPFRVRVDVGNAAVAKTIRAVGYDANGNAAGEAKLTVNDRVDAFRVAITSPVVPFVQGPAHIEGNVVVPPQRKLQRVDVFWKESKIATATSAAFRMPFDFPNEFGYVRAVAVLDDGTTAEETRLVNAEGVTENVEVRAVAFSAVVIGRDGKRITGLKSSDFVVEDERKRVDATVREGEDEPVTIGLAIDSSSSMRAGMFDVIQLASDFLATGRGSQDRVFIVAFDNTARLVHQASADVESLRRSVLELAPSGGTSLFDGIVFSLQQFQEIPGKKALVVITDGKEGASSASWREAERMSRATAVPIYALVPFGRVFGTPLFALTEKTGGDSFYRPSRNQRGEIFARIRDEVRGQYLITFLPTGVKAGSWRNVRVTVPGREATVRTVSGYFAR